MSAWTEFPKSIFWRYGWAIAVVTAFSLVCAQPARAASVRVYVLAPTPNASLLSVEKHGATPRFEKEFTIPYGGFEPLIPDEIKKDVDGSPESTAACPTAACPDLHWRVTVTSGFAFTEKGQPVLQAFGDPQQQSGVDVTAHARVKLDFNVTYKVWYEVLGDKKSASADSPHVFFINIDASGKLDLWPTLQSQSFPPTLSDDNGNVIDLTDPQGFKLLGMPTLGGGYCQAAPGTCEDAREQMEAAINTRLFAFLKNVEEQIGAWVQKGTDAGVPQAINLKDELLNTKLPVVNKSFQELSDAFELTLDVQQLNKVNSVVATLRFNPAAGNAKLIGKLRLPKERCVYATHQGGLLVTAIPSELEKINSDLAAKVGSACSSILTASSMKVLGYLGADPKVIVPGWTFSTMPSWNVVGSPSFIGNLTDHPATVTGSGAFQSTGYYECGFEISGLKNATIIRLLSSFPGVFEMLGDYAEESKKLRYLVVTGPGQQIVLDSYWDLVDTDPQGLVIGGEGQCKPFQIVKVLQVLEEFPPTGCLACGIRKFTAECPQCGITKVGEGLYEITSPLALIRNPKFKGVIDALKQDEQFPALTAPQLRLQGSLDRERAAN